MATYPNFSLAFGDALFTPATTAYSGTTGTSVRGNISWYADASQWSGGMGSGPSFTTNYNLLLQQDTYINPGTRFVILNNLALGSSYQIQIWVNQVSGLNSTFTAGNTVTLNSAGGPNNLGEYVLGTFVADSSTESITYSSVGYGVLNAVQLRNIPALPPVFQNPGVPLGVIDTVGISFSYQIPASNNPTSYGATNLPPGLSVIPAPD